MAAVKKIALITGSTRAVRIGPHVVKFVKKTILTSPSAPKTSITTIDIADYKLPVFDEPVVPAYVPTMAQFTKDHSKAWSAAIAPYDGYIIVSPEYNFGVPGSVKNAIDYLYNEWAGKPVFIVTYGIQGAKNSSENLKVTLTGMKLRVVETRPQMSFKDRDDLMKTGQGILGENSLKLWEETEKAGILKGFEELVFAVENPPAVEAAATS